MKARNIMRRVARYFLVILVMVAVWVVFCWAVEWVFGDCWLLRIDVKSIAERKC